MQLLVILTSAELLNVSIYSSLFSGSCVAANCFTRFQSLPSKLVTPAKEGGRAFL